MRPRIQTHPYGKAYRMCRDGFKAEAYFYNGYDSGWWILELTHKGVRLDAINLIWWSVAIKPYLRWRMGHLWDKRHHLLRDHEMRTAALERWEVGCP